MARRCLRRAVHRPLARAARRIHGRLARFAGETQGAITAVSLYMFVSVS
ncbi:hypothetical protein [Profundibacterium mesophilum]|uniref:Uncharacterized protein n=1 Tax=Profundibacterium mesophilum KAUST100406-0324 TaxID=1037889 RepID=A0A921TE81_9RHOB|nr:hypothetical protein [Profundibacterium mesophilum]KAF0677037.1 hypothetical protein PMES_00834 [Profundibacterium mesophilum KAUST100406-0324]